MSVFVDPNEELTVKIAIGGSKTRPNWTFADTDVKAVEETAGEDLAWVNEHEITFRVPTFADSLTYLGESVLSDPGAFKVQRMAQLLKKWDLKGADGKEVPATKETLMLLNPLVAAAILIQLDKALTERGLI